MSSVRKIMGLEGESSHAERSVVRYVKETIDVAEKYQNDCCIMLIATDERLQFIVDLYKLGDLLGYKENVSLTFVSKKIPQFITIEIKKPFFSRSLSRWKKNSFDFWIAAGRYAEYKSKFGMTFGKLGSDRLQRRKWSLVHLPSIIVGKRPHRDTNIVPKTCAALWLKCMSQNATGEDSISNFTEKDNILPGYIILLRN